jgi:hypothetical protein
MPEESPSPPGTPTTTCAEIIELTQQLTPSKSPRRIRNVRVQRVTVTLLNTNVPRYVSTYKHEQMKPGRQRVR